MPQASGGNDYGHAVDGSRMSHGTAKATERNKLPWISIELERAAAIHSLAIYVYAPNDAPSRSLGKYEVHVGDHSNDRKVTCSLPKKSEPSHDGLPLLIPCGGGVVTGAHSHVTLSLSGETRDNEGQRTIVVSEVCAPASKHISAHAHAISPGPPAQLAVFGHAASPAPPSSPRMWGAVAHEVNERFEGAHASDDSDEAGVLMHVWDGFEDEARTTRSAAA